MKDLNKMGELVRKERVKRKLSLADLSKKIEIDRTLISKIENGHYQPTEPILQRFIEVFSLDNQLAQRIWAFSGRPGGPVTTQTAQRKELQVQPVTQPAQAPNVTVDARTPVLYSDGMGVTSSEFGMVFDFGQRVGPTSNVNIVARIGVSYEHARKIMEAIHNELEKQEK
jgi:transcriptional regulator with XRE-family HTH domain